MYALTLWNDNLPMNKHSAKSIIEFLESPILNEQRITIQCALFNND